MYNIFDDFEFLDFLDMDDMLWDEEAYDVLFKSSNDTHWQDTSDTLWIKETEAAAEVNADPHIFFRFESLNFLKLDQMMWQQEEVTVTDTDLVISDCSHALTSDNVILWVEELTISNALHALTSDNLNLIEHKLLELSSSSHTLTSDNLDLIENKILALDNASHTLTSDEIQLRTLVFEILISGVWKDVDEVNVLISGVWKTVDAAEVLKSGSWEGA